MSSHGKNILFISASFFSYEKAIVKRLEDLGAKVDYFDERPSNSVITKGIIRVYSKLFQKKIDRYYNHIFKKTLKKKYDFFLLIKGEAVPFHFLKNFRKQHPETKMIFYTYDAVAEYPKFLKLFSFFDENFTFEPSDAKKYGIHFRPLFFLDDYQAKEKVEKKYDLVFIGSAHTDRYLVGESVKNSVEKMNFKTFFYYYAQGRLAFRLKRIFDKNFQEFDVKKLSFERLRHSEISKIYQEAFAVLDINKPFQFGLTMRTFETLASGKKLITTNPDIENYPFYSENNVLFIDRKNPIIKKDFFETPFQKIENQILEMMTLDSWLNAVFFENRDEYWECLLK